MALLRLYCRNRPDRNNLCEIVIVYRESEKEAYFSTGRKINKDFWNAKAASDWVKKDYGTSATTLNMVLKKKLDQAEEKMNKFYLANNRYPTRSEMKLLMSDKLGARPLFYLFDEFIKYQTSLRGTNNVKVGTYANYRKVKARLIKYQEHTGKPFDFNSIDMNFYDRFNAYCASEFGNEINTISSYVKILKTFLEWARVNHSIEISAPVIATLKVIDIKRYKVTLTIDELYKLRDTNLSSDIVLDTSRDAAILQIGLACRYGDLVKLLTDNVSFEGGRHIFRKITEKTETYIEFELSQMVVNVLRKHEGQHPKDWIPSESKQNKRLKELGRLIGMIQPIPTIKGTGIYRKDKMVRRYEGLGTHSCRRTGINLMQKSGMRDIAISEVTGQSINTIQRYKYSDQSELGQHNKILDYKPDTGVDNNSTDNAEPGQPST